MSDVTRSVEIPEQAVEKALEVYLADNAAGAEREDAMRTALEAAKPLMGATPSVSSIEDVEACLLAALRPPLSNRGGDPWRTDIVRELAPIVARMSATPAASVEIPEAAVEAGAQGLFAHVSRSSGDPGIRARWEDLSEERRDGFRNEAYAVLTALPYLAPAEPAVDREAVEEVAADILGLISPVEMRANLRQEEIEDEFSDWSNFVRTTDKIMALLPAAPAVPQPPKERRHCTCEVGMGTYPGDHHERGRHLNPVEVSDEDVEVAAQQADEWREGLPAPIGSAVPQPAEELAEALVTTPSVDEIAQVLHEEGAYCGDCDYENWKTCEWCCKVLSAYAQAIQKLYGDVS